MALYAIQNKAVEVGADPHGDGDICWFPAILLNTEPDERGMFIVHYNNSQDQNQERKKGQEVAEWVPPKKVSASMVRPKPPSLQSMMTDDIIIGETVEVWVPVTFSIGDFTKKIQNYCWRRGVFLGRIECPKIIVGPDPDGPKIAVFFPSNMSLEAFPGSRFRCALEHRDGSWFEILPQEGCPQLDDVIYDSNLVERIQLGTKFRKMVERPCKSDLDSRTTTKKRKCYRKSRSSNSRSVKQIVVQLSTEDGNTDADIDIGEPVSIFEPMNTDADVLISGLMPAFQPMNKDGNVVGESSEPVSDFQPMKKGGNTDFQVSELAFVGRLVDTHAIVDADEKISDQEFASPLDDNATPNEIRWFERSLLIAIQKSSKPKGVKKSAIISYLKENHIWNSEVEKLLHSTLKGLVQNGNIEMVGYHYKVAVSSSMEDDNIKRLKKLKDDLWLNMKEKVNICEELFKVAQKSAEDTNTIPELELHKAEAEIAKTEAEKADQAYKEALQAMLHKRRNLWTLKNCDSTGL